MIFGSKRTFRELGRTGRYLVRDFDAWSGVKKEDRILMAPRSSARREFYRNDEWYKEGNRNLGKIVFCKNFTDNDLRIEIENFLWENVDVSFLPLEFNVNTVEIKVLWFLESLNISLERKENLSESTARKVFISRYTFAR